MADYDGEQGTGQYIEQQQYDGIKCEDTSLDNQQEQSFCSGGAAQEDRDDKMDTQSPPVQTKDEIPYDEHKIFIGGLHPATTQAELEDHFSQYGKLTEVNQKFDAAKQSRGYAFLVYEDASSVQKVLDDCPHTVSDKVIDVKQAIPHEIHQQMKNKTKKLFVGGVPPEMPLETIKGYFIQFGEIEEVALVTEKGSTKRRGFIFVTYVSEKSADKACDAGGKDHSHQIGENKVEVKRATPRDQNNSHGPPHFVNRGRGHFPLASGRGQFTPYGGHASYYQMCPPPMYGGGYMGGGGGYSAPYGGYGAYGAFEQYVGNGGGGRRDDAYNNSRYGPMRSNYGHGHTHSHVHPYSR